jgi:hypothetical protein
MSRFACAPGAVGPFAVTEETPRRRVHADGHVLQLCIHHIVTDARYLSVLFNEMRHQCKAIATARPSLSSGMRNSTPAGTETST